MENGINTLQAFVVNGVTHSGPHPSTVSTQEHQPMDLGNTDNAGQQETHEGARSNTPTGTGIGPWQPSGPSPQGASSPSTRTVHLEELTPSVVHLQETVNGVQTPSIRMTALLADWQSHYEQLRSQMEKLQHSVGNLQSQQDASVLEVREMMEDFHSSTSNGTFMWRVDNVSTLFNDTRVHHLRILRSPCFYSSPSGYKMRAYMHLYRIPGTPHLFIFVYFVLCRGSFDGILSWPFTFPVVVCLFDQTSAKSHIPDLIRPDLTTKCFGRPQSDTNPGSLVACWGPFNSDQCATNPYIQGDTMFIKVMIEFQDTPFRILPHLICLNPGLSAEAQEEWRQAQLKQVGKLGNGLTGSIQKLQEEDDMARRASISYSRLPESSDR